MLDGYRANRLTFVKGLEYAAKQADLLSLVTGARPGRAELGDVGPQDGHQDGRDGHWPVGGRLASLQPRRSCRSPESVHCFRSTMARATVARLSRRGPAPTCCSTHPKAIEHHTTLPPVGKK